jgi:hypothetical protein
MMIASVGLVLPDGRMNRRNAAAYLGYAPKTLAQYASQGMGPKFIKRGRVWYFKEDLDAWLRAGVAQVDQQAARNVEQPRDCHVPQGCLRQAVRGCDEGSVT